jgi:hypothetical protein
MEDQNKQTMTEEKVLQIVQTYLKSSAFTDRKLTDNPTDALQVVNRRYVTMNGVTGSRPVSSVLGQFYYDTTIDRPIWWNGSAWKKADGTAV